MKKVIASLVAIIMLTSFAACSDSGENNNSTTTSTTTSTATETTTTTATTTEATTTTTVTTTAEITTAETSSVTETNEMEFLGDYSTDDGIYVKAYSNSIQFNVSLPNDTADNNMQRFETTSSGICDGMVGEYGAPDYIDWWVFCDNKVVFATKSEKQADGTYSFSGVSCADSKYQAAIDDFKNKYVK